MCLAGLDAIWSIGQDNLDTIEYIDKALISFEICLSFLNYKLTNWCSELVSFILILVFSNSISTTLHFLRVAPSVSLFILSKETACKSYQEIFWTFLISCPSLLFPATFLPCNTSSIFLLLCVHTSNSYHICKIHRSIQEHLEPSAILFFT